MGTSFRFPGEKGRVHFSKSLPKLNAATSVEEWLPQEYKVSLTTWIYSWYKKYDKNKMVVFNALRCYLNKNQRQS